MIRTEQNSSQLLELKYIRVVSRTYIGVVAKGSEQYIERYIVVERVGPSHRSIFFIA